MTDDDFFEDDTDEVVQELPTVTMLIVDDEPGIHDVTRLALAGFTFQGHRLEMLCALSAAEARAILEQRDDVAVMILDVVMESETAGLDLVQVIRRELGNADVRIILRTGQPGQAPEEKVIVDYDINDYKAKSELTRSHLLTSVYSALRSWRDIQDLHRYRRQAYTVAARQAVLIEEVLNMIAKPAAVCDGDGLIVVANGALGRLAGQAADDLVGFDLPSIGLQAVFDGSEEEEGGHNREDRCVRVVRNPGGVVEAMIVRIDRAEGVMS